MTNIMLAEIVDIASDGEIFSTFVPITVEEYITLLNSANDEYREEKIVLLPEVPREVGELIGDIIDRDPFESEYLIDMFIENDSVIWIFLTR